MQMYKISEKLASLREAAGITQEELAQQLSVSGKTVSKWETGISEPNGDMLCKLADYYRISVDTLLGRKNDTPQTPAETVSATFAGLSRRETILHVWQIIQAIFPAVYDTLTHEEVPQYDTVPDSSDSVSRSQISSGDFFQFASASESTNIAVTMLRNKTNHQWLGDPATQEKIADFFRFLGNRNTLSVLYFLFSTRCSENFTTEYVAAHTEIDAEEVANILCALCRYEICSTQQVHLREGETALYTCYGDNLLLSICTLTYEKLCGAHSYNYNFVDTNAKMIGGKPQ